MVLDLNTLRRPCLYTLHYLINVGVRLLIFEQNSTQHVLIPYHTFINFGKLFQSSLKDEQKSQFFIVSIENIHIIFINFSTLYYYSIPYDYLFGLNFPPNMLIPYHTFIRAPIVFSAFICVEMISLKLSRLFIIQLQSTFVNISQHSINM